MQDLLGSARCCGRFDRRIGREWLARGDNWRNRRSARAATLLGRPEARHFFAHLSDLGLQRGDLLLELDLALLGLRGDLLRALLSLRGKLARPLVGVLDQGVHFTCPLIEKL